jgi:hypothetical protein
MYILTCSAHCSDETLYNCLAEDEKTFRRMTYLAYMTMMKPFLDKLLSERITLGPFVTILRRDVPDVPETVQIILHRDRKTDDICVSFIDTSKPPTLSLELRRINGKDTMCLYIECVQPGGTACNVRVTNAINTVRYVSQIKGGFGPFQLHCMPGQPIDLSRIRSCDVPSLLYMINQSDSNMIREMFGLILSRRGYTVICEFMIMLKSDILSLIELVVSLSLKIMHNNPIIVNLLCPFMTFLSSMTTDAVNCRPPLKGSKKPAFFGKLIEMGLICAVARKHGIDTDWFPFMTWLLQMILAKLSVSAELEFLEIRERIFGLIGIQKDQKILHDLSDMPEQVAALFNPDFRVHYNHFKASVEADRVSGGRVSGGAAAHVVSAPAPVSPPLKVIEEPVCIVCMEKPQTHVLDPCGHQQMCGVCAQNCKTCPTCTTPIVKAIHVYKN